MTENEKNGVDAIVKLALQEMIADNQKLIDKYKGRSEPEIKIAVMRLERLCNDWNLLL